MIAQYAMSLDIGVPSLMEGPDNLKESKRDKYFGKHESSVSKYSFYQTVRFHGRLPKFHLQIKENARRLHASNFTVKRVNICLHKTAFLSPLLV
jgi:hypothetical protein